MTATPLPLADETAPINTDALEQQARRLAMRFSCLSAEEILYHAVNHEFKGRIALVSSFGAESAALLHLVAVWTRSKAPPTRRMYSPSG